MGQNEIHDYLIVTDHTVGMMPATGDVDGRQQIGGQPAELDGDTAAS